MWNGEESFLCHVLPSLQANISIWNVVRCTLRKIFTRIWLFSCDCQKWHIYSSAHNTDTPLWLRIQYIFFQHRSQAQILKILCVTFKCDFVSCLPHKNIQCQNRRCLHLFNSVVFFVARRPPAACSTLANEPYAWQILIFCHAALLKFPSKQCEVCVA